MIQCVPAISEGRDKSIINRIAKAVTSVKGVRLLNTESGAAVNRTVMTFAGAPDAVCEAAYRCVGEAVALIDMRSQKDCHPRIGVVDLLSLIPVSGITLDECAVAARQLAHRLADELHLPCYLFGAAAQRTDRFVGTLCWLSEYDEPEEKILTEGGKPDIGARPYDERMARTGCTAVGAHENVISVNFNLNTTSADIARAIASEVRERGYVKRKDDAPDGEILTDEQGRPLRRSGRLPGTDAMGRFIDEYGVAQVAMKIYDKDKTRLYEAYEAVKNTAHSHGVRVTGTALVGVVPKEALTEAGKYFLEKEHSSGGLPNKDLIKAAVRAMQLDKLKPFVAREKIIEYLLESEQRLPPLSALSMKVFVEQTSRGSAIPGTGAVAAYIGALGTALGTMVANLSAKQPDREDRWETFGREAESGQALIAKLLGLADEDAAAYMELLDVGRMPTGTDEQMVARNEALQAAALKAARVPLDIMRAAYDAFSLCKTMAEEGTSEGVGDAGAAALAVRAAVRSALLMVRQNAKLIQDADTAQTLVDEAGKLALRADIEEQVILRIVEAAMGDAS